MLGRQVIEGQDVVPVLEQAANCLRALRLMLRSKEVEGLATFSTSGSHPNLMMPILGRRLLSVRKLVRHMRCPVASVTLSKSLAAHLSRGLPEPRAGQRSRTRIARGLQRDAASHPWAFGVQNRPSRSRVGRLGFTQLRASPTHPLKSISGRRLLPPANPGFERIDIGGCLRDLSRPRRLSGRARGAFFSVLGRARAICAGWLSSVRPWPSSWP